MPDVKDPGFKVIEAQLLQHDAVPLFGGSPPFPLEHILQKAGDLFEIEGLTGHIGGAQWRKPEDLMQGMATPSMPIDVVCGDLDGRVIFLLADPEWDQLMTWLLTKEAKTWGIPDSGIREGFLKFVAAETLSLLSQEESYGDISFRLADHKKLPDEPTFCVDLTLKYKGEKISGRALITSSFHRSWSERFAPRKPTEITPEMAVTLEVDVHLEMGRVALSQTEWSTLQAGDCLLLDQCGWDMDAGEGPVVLTSDNNALYQGKMNNQGTIQITQVATGTQR